jgi:TonB family protein
MSSTPQAPSQHPKNENRRLHARRRIDQLTYATFGPGNGGILINLSEGGLSFQGIGVVRREQLLPLSFKLPGTGSPIEAQGEVVWSNDSGKGGGLRFIDLSEEARQRVKKWLADDASSSANFAVQVTSHSRTASTLATSDGTLIQSLPAHTAKEHPETAPVDPEPQANKPRQIFSPAPEEVPASNIGATPASTPSFVLAEYPESQPQRSPSPQFIVFATGVLAGCVGVLAAIAGVSMLVNTGRPAIPESSQSTAVLPMTDAGSQNSPVDGIVLNDRQLTLSNQNVAETEAASEGFFNNTPPQEVAAIEPAPRPELNVKSSRDSRQNRNLNDQRNLALLGPRMPVPHSRAELREPPIGDTTPPTFISVDGPRPVAPSMSDLPKPPQPSAEKVDRTAVFLDAVLIQHNSPVYPPSAMKKHIQGLVTVNATVGTDGVPRGLKLVSGDPSLGQAAQEAISHWRYVPAVSGGVPVESQVAITINFQSKP